MSNIRVDLDYPIYDGANVTFKAPCDCTGAEGLTVYYPGGSKNFVLCDAHGVNISGIGDVFMKGVPVKAILDVTNAKAFIQNGDNNSFLARMLGRISDSQHVACGSYTGTGKNSPYAVTLNFDFTPKLLLVYNVYKWEHEVDGVNYGYMDYVLAVFVNGAPVGVAHNYSWTGENAFDGWDIDASWDNNSVSFGSRYDSDETYNPYDHYNLDNTNRTYYYVAIG